MELPNAAHPGAPLEILATLEGGSHTTHCSDKGYSRITNDTCYLSPESASPSSPFSSISHILI